MQTAGKYAAAYLRGGYEKFSAPLFCAFCVPQREQGKLSPSALLRQDGSAELTEAHIQTLLAASR